MSNLPQIDQTTKLAIIENNLANAVKMLGELKNELAEVKPRVRLLPHETWSDMLARIGAHSAEKPDDSKDSKLKMKAREGRGRFPVAPDVEKHRDEIMRLFYEERIPATTIAKSLGLRDNVVYSVVREDERYAVTINTRRTAAHKKIKEFFLAGITSPTDILRLLRKQGFEIGMTSVERELDVLKASVADANEYVTAE